MQDNNTTKLVESYTKSLKELTRKSTEELLIEVIEMFLKLEREEYLKGADNDKGNGYYPRAFQGLSEENWQIRIRRSRTGKFKPALIELVKKDEELVRELALDLYKSGLSSRDTAKVLDKYFSKNMSHTKIVELANEYSKVRKHWEERELQSRYKVIFADAMHIPLRRLDSYSQEAILIFVGLRTDNKREILYFEVAPNEAARIYEEILEDMKSRGLEEVDLIVGDGLKGLPEAIHRALPRTEFQECTVHKKRGILNKIRSRDKEEVARDLRHVFALFDKGDDVEEGEKRLDNFILKWGKKYAFVKSKFKDRRFLFTYTKFAPEVRRYIYTTNSIENLNSRLRKSMRNKYSFKSWESLKNYIFVVMMEFEEGTFMKYEVNQFRNFEKCYD